MQKNKEGILQKKGGLRKAWKERYFSAAFGLLTWYEKRNSVKKSGSLSLDAATVKHVPTDGEGMIGDILAVTPAKGGRTYMLLAASEEDRMAWTVALVGNGAVCDDIVRDDDDDDIPPPPPPEEEEGVADSVEDDEKVVYRGWLLKMGHTRKAWRRRHFVLQRGDGEKGGGELRYSETENGAAKGTILLQGAAVFSCTKSVYEVKGVFGIAPAGSDRVYLLQACSEAERYMWLESLEGFDTVDSGLLEAPYKPRPENLSPSREPSTDQGLLCGFLTKRGDFNKSWKRRWFVLGEDFLTYYKEDKKTLKGKCPVKGAAVVSFTQSTYDDEDRKGHLFGITPAQSNRTYVLEAKEETERYNWLEKLGALGAMDGGLVEHQAVETALLPQLVGRTKSIKVSAPKLEDVEVVFSGWLWKKGDVQQSWKQRYFTVANNGVGTYYLEEDEKVAKGQFAAQGAEVFAISNEAYASEQRSGAVFGIKPAGGDRTFVLEADNDSSRYRWIEALVRVGAKDTGVSAARSPVRPNLLKQLSLRGGRGSQTMLATVCKEGRLVKRGGMHKAWHERIFKLTNEGELLYFAIGETKPKGRMSAQGAEVASFTKAVYEADGRAGALFGIRPAKGTRTYVMEASSIPERYDWLQALVVAGASDCGLVENKEWAEPPEQ